MTGAIIGGINAVRPHGECKTADGPIQPSQRYSADAVQLYAEKEGFPRDYNAETQVQSAHHPEMKEFRQHENDPTQQGVLQTPNYKHHRTEARQPSAREQKLRQKGERQVRR